MELHPAVLVALVVGGVSGVVALTHALGGSVRARLRDDAHALAVFAVDHPDLEASAVLLADDGSSAVLVLDDGGVGVVSALGRRWVARIAHAAQPAANGVRVDPADFGAPPISVVTADAEGRDTWWQHLRAVTP